MRFFNNIEKAEFIDRPNRFLVRCLKDGKEITAFLPNPGRLQELLLPGPTFVSNPGRHIKSSKIPLYRSGRGTGRTPDYAPYPQDQCSGPLSD